MAVRARSITAARLNDRLPVDHPHDELGRLAVVFNQTLERLEQSFEQMQRFTGDVSHELRTPLTAIRTVGEVALRESRTPDAYRTTIGSMLEEVGSADVARRAAADAVARRQRSGAPAASSASILAELADEVADVSRGAGRGERAVDHGRGDRRRPCDVDRLVLRQALINLVDNAIKYSPPTAKSRCGRSPSDAEVVLEVRNAGAGNRAGPRAQIFDRSLPRRSQAAAARARTGDCEVGRRGQPRPADVAAGSGGGSIFRITLPRATAGASRAA